MPLNTIRMDLKCGHCSTEVEIKETVIANHHKQLITELNSTTFGLPRGWISVEYLSKAAEGQGYNGAENVSDAEDFCSLECLIKYFQKKRRDLIKAANNKGKE